jgi:adenylate cyclase
MKMNYTMTGDKVNLTARLESSAKQFGIVIQVSDTIYKENKDKFIFRDLGKVVVVGRNQHLNTYELIGEPEDMDDNLAKLLEMLVSTNNNHLT